jgi:hypothetical protein
MRIVELTLDEARTLRAAVMGDAMSTAHLNSAIAKIDAACDAERRASEPNSVAESATHNEGEKT